MHTRDSGPESVLTWKIDSKKHLLRFMRMPHYFQRQKQIFEGFS